ncbi:uncharacterized protein BN452_00776 [Clostridium sp. CAG:1013]|mgnify:FL=1|nr:uncharacterized protein BN452_00776 [Clostridium sp. CAG:1013]
MRNIWKRIAAAALALAMCLSFAGCYDENKTWAARKGDDELPIGAYIYYLYSAYLEAGSQVDSETSVLDAEIEGQDAEQWIKDLALNYVQAYYYISDKFDELGLELTEEDLVNVENTASSFWSYYGSTLEELGISQDSFEKAYALYGEKFERVMKAMYGEGGELALEDGALEEYYCGAYINYEYFSASLTTTNEDGESVELTDDEKADLKETFEGYVKKINAGELTMSEAADEYAEESGTDSSLMSPVCVKSDNMSTLVFDALNSVKEGEAAFVESTSGYLVVRKLSVKDYYDEYVANSEDQQFTLLTELKGEEYSDYVLEQAASVEGVELNQAAMDSIKVSSLVDDSNRNGTSSAEETESSSADENSSEEESSSSETSSSETE